MWFKHRKEKKGPAGLPSLLQGEGWEGAQQPGRRAGRAVKRPAAQLHLVLQPWGGTGRKPALSHRQGPAGQGHQQESVSRVWVDLQLLVFPAAGQMVPQNPSQVCSGPENTHQGGAGGWEDLQVVCVWPQQEAGESPRLLTPLLISPSWVGCFSVPMSETAGEAEGEGSCHRVLIRALTLSWYAKIQKQTCELVIGQQLSCTLRGDQRGTESHPGLLFPCSLFLACLSFWNFLSPGPA